MNFLCSKKSSKRKNINKKTGLSSRTATRGNLTAKGFVRTASSPAASGVSAQGAGGDGVRGAESCLRKDMWGKGVSVSQAAAHSAPHDTNTQYVSQ